MRVLALAIALALPAAPPPGDLVREARAAMGEAAQEASSGRYHLTLESAPWIPPGSAERLAGLLAALEEAYRVFWREGIPLREPSADLRVFQFARKGSLRGFMGRMGVATPSFEAGGVYLPDARVLLVETGSALERSRVALLVHEAAHFLNRELLDGAKLSPWLNEGLAQMAEFSRIDQEAAGARFRLGEIDEGSELRIPDGESEIVHRFAPSRSLSYLQGQFMRHRAISLGPLLDVRTGAEFYGDGAQLRYAQAWTLVHMLARGSARGGGPPLRPVLDRVVKLEREGRGGREALLAAAGLTLEELDEAWYRHLKILW